MHPSVPRNNTPMTVRVKKIPLTVMILDISQQLKCPRALHSADRHPPLSHGYRHEVPQELPRRSCVCALMGVHPSNMSWMCDHIWVNLRMPRFLRFSPPRPAAVTHVTAAFSGWGGIDKMASTRGQRFCYAPLDCGKMINFRVFRLSL